MNTLCSWKMEIMNHLFLIIVAGQFLYVYCGSLNADKRTVRHSRQVSKPVAIIPSKPAKDCCEILQQGYTECGVYQIRPTDKYKTPVYCDMKEEGGGWTVLIRREPIDGPKINFYVNKKSYLLGFGNPSTTYWLGLKTWGNLLAKKDHELKVCFETFAGKKYQGTYKSFYVDPNNDYQLSSSEFSGNMGNSLEKHNNAKFNSPEADGCAKLYRAGWWYHENGCYDVLLTGKYKEEKDSKNRIEDDYFDYGIVWNSVTSIPEDFLYPNGTQPRKQISLKYVTMKVRSKNGCSSDPGDLGIVQPEYII